MPLTSEFIRWQVAFSFLANMNSCFFVDIAIGPYKDAALAAPDPTFPPSNAQAMLKKS